MLGIDHELEELYQQAKVNGHATIKGRWTSTNYNCCSTRAPLIEKYRIEYHDTEASLFIWHILAVKIHHCSKTIEVYEDDIFTNYDKKIIEWFIQKDDALTN
ncbi:hypothetical protein RV04_GL001772 [Enterococcus hermanniensis]|uniref:Uncharacterized protein n=2 Tax=Enterococcus hermanniensis TaxID=249189 RepID=A0A1L8TNW5_9ENTE|nr:hypothetical protein RV04_GL001772 [Enterococcus hermanniensis]